MLYIVINYETQILSGYSFTFFRFSSALSTYFLINLLKYAEIYWKPTLNNGDFSMTQSKKFSQFFCKVFFSTFYQFDHFWRTFFFQIFFQIFLKNFRSFP